MIRRSKSVFLGFVLATFLPGAEWLDELRQRCVQDGRWSKENMKLQIVWRNPHPPLLTKLLVKQIVADAYGALYEVRSRHQLQVFELISPPAA